MRHPTTLKTCAMWTENAMYRADTGAQGLGTNPIVEFPPKTRLTMEAVASERNLSEIIGANGRLEDGVARFYFGQLLNAIDRHHSKGVCHRDIKLRSNFSRRKPENVLLDRHGNVRLRGFARWRSKAALPRMAPLTGLCNSAVARRRRIMVHPPRETPEHAAPEVLQGFAYDGKAADVWSLGMTLGSMLIGVPPLAIDKAQARGLHYSPSLSVMRPSAHSLVECMMHSDPTKRYTTAQIRSHPWFTQTRVFGGRGCGTSFSDDDGGASSGSSDGGGRSESSYSRTSSTSSYSSTSSCSSSSSETSDTDTSTRGSTHSTGSGRGSV
ncbi:unnamed protein product [Scytosiphon promiscuus]